MFRVTTTLSKGAVQDCSQFVSFAYAVVSPRTSSEEKTVRMHKPENFVTAVFQFLPYVACMRAQDRTVVFSFRPPNFESVKRNQ